MLEVNMITLENGVEYAEVDNLVYEDIKYVLLSNIDNVKDSCIRKIIIEDNKRYVYRLDNPKEFDTVLNLFMKKNEALFS